MLNTFVQTAGSENDRIASPFGESDAERAEQLAVLYTSIILTTADWAMRMCEKTSCPCALIAIDESLRYIVRTDAEGYAALRGNT